MVVPETVQDKSRNRVSFDIKGKGPVGKEKGVINRTSNEPSDDSEKPAKSGRGRSKKQTNEQSREENKRNGITPYQGKHHACGRFRCDFCENEWFSANSWANCYQICNGCKREIYPHAQFKPEKSKSGEKKIKKHPEKKCQKCRDLGHSCVPEPTSPRKGCPRKGMRGKKRTEESHEREE